MVYVTAMLISVILVLAVLEILSLTMNLNKVVFRCSLNMELTEPDEVMTLSYRVGNTSRRPLMFIGFSFMFSDAVKVVESEEWMEQHRTGSLLSETYTVNAYLMPRSGLRGQIRLAAVRRGVHRIGKVYSEAGDFLGLTTRVIGCDLELSVVCTARPCDDEPALSALGGMMGDISVRRFIMEDPSLVLGYREYTGAEPFRSISWTQTAKTSALTVRRHDFTVDNDVAVLVDIEQTDKKTAERCLSLLRTACGELEKNRIPYALHSNGDLFDAPKGSGRKHEFAIQRRIGVSRFARFHSFADVVDRALSEGSGVRGAIVIAPKLAPDIGREIDRIAASTGAAVCVLTGEEAPA